MLAFELTPGTFASIKDTLRVSVPGAGSARRVEAAARGLGFNTHAALRASLSAGPLTATADAKAFSDFLSEAGDHSGEAFLVACAVQVMLATVGRFPQVPMDDLSRHLGTDAQAWGQPRAKKAAALFLNVLARLQTPSFLKGMGSRINAHQILLLARYDFFYPPELSVTAAAALHAGLLPVEDQRGREPPTFHRPRFYGPDQDPVYRHKEFGFAFACKSALLGPYTSYGYGTLAEASRFAEILRGKPDDTCLSHRSLPSQEWDAVRQDSRTHVMDLCSEIAFWEGRPYPGRPWSEERAKVRDDFPLPRIVKPLGAATQTL